MKKSSFASSIVASATLAFFCSGQITQRAHSQAFLKNSETSSSSSSQRIETPSCMVGVPRHYSSTTFQNISSIHPIGFLWGYPEHTANPDRHYEAGIGNVTEVEEINLYDGSGGQNIGAVYRYARVDVSAKYHLNFFPLNENNFGVDPSKIFGA